MFTVPAVSLRKAGELQSAQAATCLVLIRVTSVEAVVTIVPGSASTQEEGRSSQKRLSVPASRIASSLQTACIDQDGGLMELLLSRRSQALASTGAGGIQGAVGSAPAVG